jgi:hypothetical protein
MKEYENSKDVAHDLATQSHFDAIFWFESYNTP